MAYSREWNYYDLPDAIYNGIVYSVGFGKERTPDREERANLSRLEDARVIDN